MDVLDTPLRAWRETTTQGANRRVATWQTRGDTPNRRLCWWCSTNKQPFFFAFEISWIGAPFFFCFFARPHRKSSKHKRLLSTAAANKLQNESFASNLICSSFENIQRICWSSSSFVVGARRRGEQPIQTLGNREWRHSWFDDRVAQDQPKETQKWSNRRCWRKQNWWKWRESRRERERARERKRKRWKSRGPNPAHQTTSRSARSKNNYPKLASNSKRINRKLNCNKPTTKIEIEINTKRAQRNLNCIDARTQTSRLHDPSKVL